MNTEKEKEFLEEMIEKTEYALRCAAATINETSSLVNDVVSAKTVLNLVKARAALVAEYIALAATENDE